MNQCISTCDHQGIRAVLRFNNWSYSLPIINECQVSCTGSNVLPFSPLPARNWRNIVAAHGKTLAHELIQTFQVQICGTLIQAAKASEISEFEATQALR